MSKLQQEKELLQQLNSEKRSVRIQVIVKLARAGCSVDSIKALQKLVNSDDREISFFSAQAIARISKKIGNLPEETQQEEKQKQTDEISDQNNVYDRKTFLNPPKEKIEELLNWVRSNYSEIPSEMLPAVGVFLTKNGDLSDSEFIEHQLLNESSSLILPFINAAEKIVPAVLARCLPKILASKQPLVRSRAIDALRRIDPEEAERHFSDFLASKNPEDRLAGISIAFQFPFNRVREYILAMLPEENDREVLVACQTILASNPEIDTALQILDNLEVVSPEQKKKLSVIYKTICKALSTAKLLSEEEADPQAIIKVWKNQRLDRFLQDIEIQLAFVSEDKKKSIISWLEKNKAHPKVKQLVKKLVDNPQFETIAAELNFYQTQAEPQILSSGQKAVNQTSAQETENRISEKEIIGKLKSIEIETFKTNKAWIIEQTNSDKPLIRAEALQALARLHPDNNLKQLAKDNLASDNLKLKIVSFQILERIDPIYLKTQIESLFMVDESKLRVRVIRFALKHDEKQALEKLSNMLKSSDHSTRSIAVSCMGLCPFEKVMKNLMDQLDNEDHPVIAKQIVNLLICNPARAVLRGLDNITRTSNPAVAMVISQGRNEMFDLVSELGLKDETTDSAETQDSSKPYSVSNVRKISNKTGKDWKPSYKVDQVKTAEPEKAERNWTMIISGAVTIVVLASLPVMFLINPGTDYSKLKNNRVTTDRERERKSFSRSKIPESFRMNKLCIVSAKVSQIKNAKELMLSFEGRKVMVQFENDLPQSLLSGETVKVKLVPYRVTPSGIVIAQGEEILKPGEK